MVMPTLSDYQYAFTDDGIILNGNTLPMWDVQKVSGLDFPELTVNRSDYDGVHGGFVTATFFDPRTIVIEGVLYADPLTVDSAGRSMGNLMMPSSVDKKLWIKPAGIATSYINCKATACKVNLDTARRIGSAGFQLQFEAGDPRIYQDITVPNLVGATATNITNQGLIDSFPTLTITGAFTNVTLNVAGYGNIVFNGVNATVGQVTIIDLANRIVTKQGVNVTSTYVSGEWPTLRPGTSAWTVTYTGGTPTTAVAAQSAWML